MSRLSAPEKSRLFAAIGNDNLATVAQIIKQNGLTTATTITQNNETLLAFALHKRAESVAVWLVEQGCLGGQAANGPNFLFSAGFSAKVMRALLGAGTDPRATSDMGDGPAYFCAFNGTKESMRMLADAGADLNTRYTLNGAAIPALFAAADRPEMMHCMLDCGADPHILGEYGETSIQRACQWNDSNRPQRQLEERLAVIARLLDAGVPINASSPNFIYGTALHTAVHTNCGPIVRLLLSRGADTSIPDREGKTARELAYAGGNEEMKAVFRAVDARNVIAAVAGSVVEVRP